MKNNNRDNQYRSELDMVKRGCLMASYGKNYFFTICSALGIGKFRCSVVKLKTQGTDAYDIYLSSGDVKRLVDDIIRGTFFKKIQEESSKYPSTYSYTKGTNGANILNIGKSTTANSIAVQAGLVSYDDNGTKGKTDLRLTPVSEDDIRDFAVRYYVCVCGLLPTPAGFTEVPSNSYYAKLQKAFWESEKEHESFYASKENSNSSTSGSNEDASTDKPNPQHQNNEESNTKPASSKPYICVRSTSTLNRNEDGSYRMQAVKEADGTIINISIPADAIAAMGETTFNKFCDKVNNNGSTFNFSGKKMHRNGEDIYVFAEFVNVK